MVSLQEAGPTEKPVYGAAWFASREDFETNDNYREEIVGGKMYRAVQDGVKSLGLEPQQQFVVTLSVEHRG